MVEYSRAELIDVANEVAELPEEALLLDWLADYAVIRNQARACASILEAANRSAPKRLGMR